MMVSKLEIQSRRKGACDEPVVPIDEHLALCCLSRLLYSVGTHMT